MRAGAWSSGPLNRFLLLTTPHLLALSQPAQAWKQPGKCGTLDSLVAVANTPPCLGPYQTYQGQGIGGYGPSRFSPPALGTQSLPITAQSQLVPDLLRFPQRPDRNILVCVWRLSSVVCRLCQGCLWGNLGGLLVPTSCFPPPPPPPASGNNHLNSQISPPPQRPSPSRFVLVILSFLYTLVNPHEYVSFHHSSGK